MGLAEYKAKRDFQKTAEPKGDKPLPKAVRGASRFVIQKHDARRLHYDFRLQMEGVLKSWAVPKGLPWKQGEKHLAVEVEDHPIEYEDFEGVIPEGKLHLVLEGKKAKGEWTLVRIRRDQEKNQWLLMKTGASARPLSKRLEDQSAKSSRTMKQIAKDRAAEWESDRDEPTTDSTSSAKSALRARIKTALKKKEEAGRSGSSHGKDGGRPGGPSLPASLPSSKPRFIQPMKPRLVEKPP